MYNDRLNWYKVAKTADSIYLEAGLKDYIPMSLMSALLAVLMGSSLWNASSHYNVDQEELRKVLQNKEIVEKVKSNLAARQQAEQAYQEEQQQLAQNEQQEPEQEQFEPEQENVTNPLIDNPNIKVKNESNEFLPVFMYHQLDPKNKPSETSEQVKPTKQPEQVKQVKQNKPTAPKQNKTQAPNAHIDNIIDTVLEHEGLLPGQTPFRITNKNMRNWDRFLGFPINKKPQAPSNRKNFLFFKNPEHVKPAVKQQLQRYVENPKQFGLSRNPTLEEALRKFDQTNVNAKIRYLKSEIPNLDIRTPLKDLF